MKILLINNNPVVSKLVTLSAQKTSDELEVVTSVDAIASSRYNLVVIDDALYSDSLFADLNKKISFDKSLYICSRDAQEVESFNEVLKKPFLPTDLVEIFIKIGKSASDLNMQDDDGTSLAEIEPKIEDTLSTSEEDLKLDDLDEDLVSLDDDLGDLKLDDLDEDTISLDDELGDLKLDNIDEDAITLDNEIEDTLGESVLDHDEAQEVKDLLDETEDNDLKLEEFDRKNDLDLASNFPVEELEASTIEEEDLNDLDLDISADDNEVVEDSLNLEELESDTLSHEDENETIEENQDFNDLETETQESEVASDEVLEDDNEVVEESLNLEELESDTLSHEDENETIEENQDFNDLETEIEESEVASDEVLEDDNEVVEDSLNLEELESDTLSHEDENETIEENQDFNDLETETQESEVVSDEALEDDKDNEVVEQLESDVSKIEEEDLESQIKSAVDTLSDEDLASEVDEEIVDAIISHDLDALTSKDLKLAVGEAIESEDEESEIKDEITTNIEKIGDVDASVTKDESNENVEGVEALKTLLTALTDKNVAASMKGMKITINITLGDK